MSAVEDRAVVAAVVITAMMVVVPASAQEPVRRIERIDIVRQNIFDLERREEQHAFASVINTLHVVTSEEVIRRELLYREGEVLDEALLAETERNLRALGFIGDVETRVQPIGDSAAIITVTVQDKWAIDFLPSYKQEGGVQTYRFTLKDDNLLGNGQSVSLTYDYNTGRPVPHGTEMTFRERNAFGSRVEASFRYRNSWEAHLGSIALARAYYSDRATWAGGLVAELGDRRYVYHQDGQIIQEEKTSQELQSGWLSASFGTTTLWRPGLGYTRARSGLLAPRVFDNLDMLTAGITLLGRSFVERSFLNSFGRVEDVPLGVVAGVTVGKNFWHRPGLSPDYMVSLFGRHALVFGRGVYVGWEGSLTSYFGGAIDHETTLNLLLLHHIKPSELQTLVAWMTVTAGFGWSARRQILLGSSSGLRGFGEYELAGDRRITYGIEHRIFSDIDVFIFRFGAAAFLDGGTAWFGGSSPWKQRYHHGAGLGLRIENTKLQGAGLIRIDFAMNLDRGRFSQVILSSTLPMSAFLALDGSGPWQPPENR
jgi:hypothetical protein